MRSILLIITLALSTMSWVKAQPVVFSYSNHVKFLKPGTNDTLAFPFIGGLNAPQFSQIDLDGDNVKDLFVFDRDGNIKLTFLFKDGKYVYEPKYESMFPELTDWVLLVDYNCDGKPDIFTEVNGKVKPEPEKYILYAGIRSIKNVSTTPGELKWLQDKNQLYDMGVGLNPPTNISFASSDIPSLADIDNDGDMDILCFPLGKNVITYYQNMSKELGYNCDSLKFTFRDEAWGYASYLVNGHGFWLGDNSPYFRNYKTKMHNGTTMLLLDRDGDGDKDLIYGDISFNTLLSVENGRTLNKLGRDSLISQDTIFPKNTKQAIVETFPAAYSVDVDNDGKKDLIITTNAHEGSENTNHISFYKNTGTSSVPSYSFIKSNFLIEETIDNGSKSIPVFVDIDNDGDKDLILATHGSYKQTQNNSDRMVLYKNITDSLNPVYVLTDTNFLNINAGTTQINELHPAFGDLNGDGKPDLIIGDINGYIHYYENQSSGPNISFSKISANYFNIYCGTFVTPQLVDLNKDGKLDLVMGRKNGTIVYYQNTGTSEIPNFSSSPTIDSLGKVITGESFDVSGTKYYLDGYSTVHVCDIDNDGNWEMLVGCESGEVFLYRDVKPNPNAIFEIIDKIYNDNGSTENQSYKFGKRTAAAVSDLNGDGTKDMIIGNNRGGIRFYTSKVTGVISGIKSIAKPFSDLKIYPNPAQQELYVETGSSLVFLNYQILNCIGQKLQEGELDPNTNLINLRNLENGLYFITFYANNGNSEVKKFIISR